ncbi:transcriptional regulatory protein YebC [Sodalis praecaptivus]
MAGHSKWANTKHRKAAQDAKRGKIFTKIIRELVTAARLGGGDVGSNPRLRVAVDKALANNMTRDTLNRAIARGVGEMTTLRWRPSFMRAMVQAVPRSWLSA